MIVVVVQLPVANRSRDAAIESARKTAPTYTGLASKGLIRKYYINGDAGAGGVYLWKSEAAARAWYTPEMGGTDASDPSRSSPTMKALLWWTMRQGKFGPHDAATPFGQMNRFRLHRL
jgi:hypothetical protein